MSIRNLPQKLARLREIDGHCLLPGAEIHRYRLNPVLDRQQVVRFETEHEIELPDDYREFLINLGDGGAGPCYGLSSLSGAAIWGPLKDPFPFTDPVHPFADVEEVDDEPYDALRTRCYSGCLLIGHEGCGHWIMLVVSGQERGNIWYDHNVDDGGFRPARKGFATWYECWLDEWLSDPGLRDRLERQWAQATCLGFPQQCPRCFSKNVQSSEMSSPDAMVIVSSSSSLTAGTRSRRCTCGDCGYSLNLIS